MGYDLLGISLGDVMPEDSGISVATQDPYNIDLGAYLPGDVVDNAKMQVSAADAAAPWWQTAIQTGITRLIDNTTGPTRVSGNTDPGSFAGSNGQTYPQDVARRSPASIQSTGGGVNMLLLLGLAYLLIKG